MYGLHYIYVNNEVRSTSTYVNNEVGKLLLVFNS